VHSTRSYYPLDNPRSASTVDGRGVVRIGASRGVDAMATDVGTVVSRARSDVTLQRVGREAILHDAANGQAHVINASAARIWELLDGRPMDDLIVEFAEPYGRSPDELRPDVERVVARFAELGLLSDQR
jgi:PqqD family protein of HPr-rel-A system